MADDPKKPEEQEEVEATAEATPAPEPTAEAPEATEAEATEATEAVAEEPAAEKPKAKPRARKKPAAKADKADAKPDKKPDAPVAEKAKPAPTRRKAGEAAPVVRAHAKYVRTSARKARLVCDHIRGKDVIEARAILAFTPRAVARDWSKLLESAVANAENNHELIGDELRIASVTADEGPTLKRFRPRAMGRATKIRKRTSHLTITLTPKE
jgi:ribosomal protein L22